MAVETRHIENAAKARAIYTAKQFPGELRAAWHFELRAARRDVANALRASAYLSDMVAALRINSRHSAVFRHLMAPPLSQDQFKLICPEYSKQAENNGKPIEASSARIVVDAILPRLDPGFVSWMAAGRSPRRQEVRTVLKVAAALIAQQRFATARRTRYAFEQESAVIQLLESEGWMRQKSGIVAVGASVQPKHFMHKTRFATKTLPAEVDIACGLKNTIVLAMECKVTNDETNSVKRINDVLKKAEAWKTHWGSFVRTAALLEGVVAAKDVQRLADADVEVFWSHDLEAFRDWLQAQFS